MIPLFILLSANIGQFEPRSSAAVIAVDNSWEKAEIRGDGDYLEQLFLPSYISVGSDGTVTSGEQIISRARSRTGAKAAEFAALVAKYKLEHPMRPEVFMLGDTAILKWVVPGSGRVASADIFVYRRGRWQAAYSQHSTSK